MILGDKLSVRPMAVTMGLKGDSDAEEERPGVAGRIGG